MSPYLIMCAAVVIGNAPTLEHALSYARHAPCEVGAHVHDVRRGRVWRMVRVEP